MTGLDDAMDFAGIWTIMLFTLLFCIFCNFFLDGLRVK